MDNSLRDLARSIAAAHTLEDLVRTLLGTLQAFSGLDSVYLTRIHEERLTQEVMFATNQRCQRINIPEGLIAEWQDTICRRAIADDTPYTPHADRVWSDIRAVQDLNIRTYLSEPVRNVEGELMGTLCAVSDRRVLIDDDTWHLIGLFARLIAHQYEREHSFRSLQRFNEQLLTHLSVDALTGVANRQGLLTALGDMLAEAAADGGRVVAVFIDLDRLVAINDLHGRRVGDHFLVAMAGRLAAATRGGELVARHGGDEFVVVLRLEAGAVADPLDPALVEADMADRFATVTRGHFKLGSVSLDYPGASVGAALARQEEDAEALLHRADTALREARRARAEARQVRVRGCFAGAADGEPIES